MDLRNEVEKSKQGGNCLGKHECLFVACIVVQFELSNFAISSKATLCVATATQSEAFSYCVKSLKGVGF